MEKGELTITNTIVECYKIRHSSGMYWADITIDSDGSTGRISIASDYGSWQYYWGDCGCAFKKFLIGLDRFYVAGKFGCSKWFDLEKTITEFKSVIDANIDDGYLDKDEGDEALEELEILKNNSSCQEEFCRNLEDCGIIMRLYDHCPPLIYGIDPGFNKFWDNVWLAFTSQLKEEMN